MTRFQFVADHRDAFEVKRMCQIVEISRTSFYAWESAAEAEAARAAADAELAARIRAVHAEDAGNRAYGAPRVTAELNDGAPVQERVNHKRVARVMAAHGIAGIRLRRRVRTTIGEPAEQVVPDLLERTSPPTPRTRSTSGTSPRSLLNKGAGRLAAVLAAVRSAPEGATERSPCPASTVVWSGACGQALSAQCPPVPVSPRVSRRRRLMAAARRWSQASLGITPR